MLLAAESVASRPFGAQFIRAVSIGVLIGAAVLTVFFALNFYSLGRGGQGRIAEGFASGALSNSDDRPGDSINGRHQFNDCVIIGMALDQRGTSLQLTVSPSRPFKLDTPGVCSQLLQKPSNDGFFYHNYVHGQTTLIRYLLPTMSIEMIRKLYRSMLLLALALGIAFTMLRLAKGQSESLVFLVCFLALWRAFGLETFGQSLGHAPSDFVLVLYVLILSRCGFSETALVIVAALFGALTMVFELMTGGLPLGLAATIGLTWFASPDRRIGSVIRATCTFLAAFVTCFCLKMAAVFYVFGAGAAMVQALANRVDGVPPEGSPGVFHAIADGLEGLMPGAALFLVLAIGAGAWGFRRRHEDTGARLLLLSNVPIIGWFVLFHQHTIIHAWFMDRILVWVVFSGFVLFCLALSGTGSCDPLHVGGSSGHE